MARYPGRMAVAFGVQSAEGTVNGTIKALSGALALADGIVKGHSDVGQYESGLEFTTGRRGRSRGFASGGFTWTGDDFLEEEVRTFALTFPLAGPRTAASTPAVDADFAFPNDVGIDAILRAGGLGGAAWGAGVGEEYTPQNAEYVTAKLWLEGQHWVLMDCICSLSFTLTPGEIGLVKATFQGTVESVGTGTFPTLTYGVQDSVSPPVVESMTPVFGVGLGTRGWSELEISIDNEIEAVADSAAVGGRRAVQQGREITISMRQFDTDTDEDFVQSNVRQTGTPTDDLTATTGATADGEDAIHYALDVANIQLDEQTPDRVGGSSAPQITGRASATTDGGEFALRFV